MPTDKHKEMVFTDYLHFQYRVQRGGDLVIEKTKT